MLLSSLSDPRLLAAKRERGEEPHSNACVSISNRINTLSPPPGSQSGFGSKLRAFLKQGWARAPRPLQVAILEPVALLVVFMAVFIAGFNYYNTSHAVRNLSETVLSSIADETREEVHTFVHPAAPTLGLTYSLMSRQPERYGLFAAQPSGKTTWRARANLLLPFAMANAQLNQFAMIYYGDRWGDFTAVYRHPTKGLCIIHRWLVKGKTRREVYQISATGSWKPTDEPERQFDCRTRPWYRDAAAKRKFVFTIPYMFFEGLQPGITGALPVLDPHGKLMGVFGIDYELTALDDFVHGLQSRSRVFVLSEEGAGPSRLVRVVALANRALAVPGRELPLPDGRLRLPRASDSADPVLREAAARFPAWKGDLHASSIDFSVNGQRYLGTATPLSFADLKWTIVVVVDADTVLGSINRDTRFTLLMCVVGLIGAVLLTYYLSGRIAWPLCRLSEEMKRIGKLNISTSPIPRSNILEVDEAGHQLELMKASLRSFGKYVGSEVAFQPLRSGQDAQLGGQISRVTLFFADIVGFSAISEQLAPDVLVDALANYLEEMETIIRDHEGLVDKFSGDSIMAIWGAPIRPTTYPEREACAAALEHVERLRLLKVQREAEGKTVFEAGIGIHTGDALVGNIGSSHRINYTAMGDTVNVASRLEGLTRVYRTRILISEVTYQAVREEFETRLIDLVAVKGRKHGTALYELLDRRGALSATALKMCQLYAEGQSLYHERNWQAAQAKFAEALAIAPGDGPSQVFIQRCELYQQNPPAPDWNGVYVFTTK